MTLCSSRNDCEGNDQRLRHICERSAFARTWGLSVQRSRLSRVDLVLLGLAALMASVTLTYPLGRDQSLYYYVGREWLHGAVPYRDMMEQKPPLIYLIHAATVLLFGERLWGIRLVEA